MRASRGRGPASHLIPHSASITTRSFTEPKSMFQESCLEITSICTSFRLSEKPNSEAGVVAWSIAGGGSEALNPPWPCSFGPKQQRRDLCSWRGLLLPEASESTHMAQLVAPLPTGTRAITATVWKSCCPCCLRACIRCMDVQIACCSKMPCVLRQSRLYRWRSALTSPLDKS